MSDANTTLRPESPLNILVKEAERKMAWNGENGRAPDAIDGYVTGATDGWNRCLDEVIKELDLEVDNLMMSWKASRAESLTKLKYRIEKLRR